MRISDWSSYVCSSDLAGDSGKGFAVVASEVKDLAQETSKATASIAERVAAIQTDASEALDAIGRVSETIQRIAESQHTIASAVEEQSATTLEIGRAVPPASQTTNGFADVAQRQHDFPNVTTPGPTQILGSAKTSPKRRGAREVKRGEDGGRQLG